MFFITYKCIVWFIILQELAYECQVTAKRKIINNNRILLSYKILTNLFCYTNYCIGKLFANSRVQAQIIFAKI